MHDHPFFAGGRRLGFAHRGGASSAPENTLAAFAFAVEMGFTHLETDVHVTSDGVLVAFHDDDLQRTCGDPRTIATMTRDELSRLLVDGSEPIPLLEDILDTWPEVYVNIDCKTDRAVEPLVRLLNSRRSLLERVCIGSFDDSRLDAIRRAVGPGLITSMGPKAVARLAARSVGLPVGLRGDQAACAQVPVKQGPVPVVTRSFVDTAHEAGVHVHVWTIDDPLEIARLFDLGVDGVMSDDLHSLRSVMQQKGHW